MNKPVIIAIVGLAVAVIAALLAVKRPDEESRAPTAAVAPAEPVVAAAPQASQREPAFDVVRIDKSGDAVIAGRAMPKAEVIILDGGKELGRATADGRGEWVFVPSGPLAPGARQLSLKANNPDGSTAEASAPVVLVVPERGKGQAVVFKVLPGGGSKLLQAPLGDADGLLSLEAIDHDDKGRLWVSGKAPAQGRVHLYLDNRFLGRADADADGAWRQAGKAPGEGQHLLRADLVDGKGKVLARVEVSFNPGESAQAPAAGDTVVVMSGNSLWRIARRIYGAGAAYTTIFTANKGVIRDPDLIYPGQVFTVPGR